MSWFNITPEGAVLKPGFNFYPLSCISSFGFRFKTANSTLFVRYRKRFKPRLLICKIDKAGKPTWQL